MRALPGQDKDILVGFSGGVDSVASASMLRDDGWNVTLLYLSMSESTADEADEAHRAASMLGLPLIVKEVGDSFEREVVAPFMAEYLQGRTPNPCVFCNPNVKFHYLASEADRLGARFIATGHYVRTGIDREGEPFLRKAKNISRDQSYMLYRLPKELIAKTLFPLGKSSGKDEVRAYLRSLGLKQAEKKDSQDVCFVDGGSYQDFMTSRGLESKPGKFVDASGAILGEHGGIHRYTVGQRKGLGLAVGKPVFVLSIHPETNTVVVGEEDALYKTLVDVRCVYLTSCGDVVRLPQELEGASLGVKLRYTSQDRIAVLRSGMHGEIAIEFEEPVRAPTPGQSAVFYRGDRLIGGGIITAGKA